MDGFVYVQTNDAEQNEVVVFGREADGTLTRLGSHFTGGKAPARRICPRKARSSSRAGACS